MNRKRRSFTPEFKRAATGQVMDQGYSVTEASRSLDVVESALRRDAAKQSVDAGATETPGAGIQGPAPGTGKANLKRLLHT
jgi:transposase